MVELRLVYDSLIHIENIPNPEQLTYQKLISIFPRVFKQLPEKYAIQYRANKDYKAIRNMDDLDAWVKSLGKASEKQKQESFSLYIVRVSQTEFSASHSKRNFQDGLNLNLQEQLKNKDLQMVAEQLSAIKISEEVNKIGEYTSFMRKIQSNKNEKGENEKEENCFIDMVKSIQQDYYPVVMISDINDPQEEVRKKMGRIQIEENSDQDSSSDSSSQGCKVMQIESSDSSQEEDSQKPYKQTPRERMNNNGLVVHNRIRCGICRQINITGIRYNCTVCQNYDLCQTCEETGNHGFHPLIKLRKPQSVKLETLRVISQSSESPTLLTRLNKQQKKEMKRQDFLKREQEFFSNEDLQAKTIASASQLAELIGIPYQECLGFVKKHPNRSFDQLFNSFFQKKAKHAHH